MSASSRWGHEYPRQLALAPNAQTDSVAFPRNWRLRPHARKSSPIRDRACRLIRIVCLALTISETAGADVSERLEEVTTARPFLRWTRPAYHNYAHQNVTNSPGHMFPYVDTPKSRHDFMGNYLMTGYDLYRWEETRILGQEYGSAIFKEFGLDEAGGTWPNAFDYVVAGSDGYRRWGYNMIVGDALIARFTPLTLSKVNYNGARLDVSTPYLKLTGLASRQERPKDRTRLTDGSFQAKTHFADDSNLLLGSRAQVDLGRLQIGLNWVNQHVYQSTQPGNSLKGRLKPDQPMTEYLLVRFTDDSPDDDTGGAVVRDVHLLIDGEVRRDLTPRVIGHTADPPVQVGFVSVVTGKFSPLPYNRLTASTGGTGFFNETFYRERDLPLYADYLTRIDHADGVDVSKVANAAGLETTYELHAPERELRADGKNQLVFVFDLSAEPSVKSVEVDALLGNDYHVDVAMLYAVNQIATAHADRFNATYYHVVLRAEGNVRDLSNLRRVRFSVGENTGQFVYGADVQLVLSSLEIHGEYARSSLYSRYPARVGGQPAFDDAPRFNHRGAAYFLNAVHRFQRGLVGGELFSIDPGFQTEMRSYLHNENPLWLGMFSAVINSSMYWQLVEDNDDGDRDPDRQFGNPVAVSPDQVGTDLDGVWLNQDEDNDGAPDINRNLNRVPDYDEPFLMFDVEPNSYVYGLDCNNNNEPDPREDDGDVDYPYDYDQRGWHLFGQWQLTPRWSAGVGRYEVAEIAGGGRNRSTYGLLSYRREQRGRLQRLSFESGIRRVQDDIPDEIMTFDPDIGTRQGAYRQRGIFNAPATDSGFGLPVFTFVDFIPDLLFYRDSFVSDTYLEGRLRPWSKLEVVQKLRLRLNWQQGGRLYNGNFQRDRRLDFWTWVSRVQYPVYWGSLGLTPQYKFMILRSVDRERDVRLQSEYRSVPILRLEYPLLRRTSLAAGIQGLGPVPYRRKNHTDRRLSFEQRTFFGSLRNRSNYFGYELVTIVGFNKDRVSFDQISLKDRNVDLWSFYVRTVVGFTEFGRPL